MRSEGVGPIVRYDWFHGIDTVGTGAGADAIGPARPLQSFSGNVGLYTPGCKFIDNTLNSGIMKFISHLRRGLLPNLCLQNGVLNRPF